MSRFAAEVFENEYLPEGASEVHAVVTVTAGGNDPGVGDAAADGTGTVARAAEIVIIDSSGSMADAVQARGRPEGDGRRRGVHSRRCPVRRRRRLA